MILSPETISTGRLVLRKPRLEDAPVMFATYVQDPEVTRYLTWHAEQTLDETREFLVRTLAAWDRGSSFAWVITMKETGTLMGMIDVRLEPHANLGYVLAQPYWNKGYTTEAVKAVVEWAMGQEEICRVWAVCDVENIASARVLAKAGLECEGILRRWIVLPNRSTTPRDCFCYAKVK
jgi:RimJ/RimL family protein N-acetyltransferase